MKRSLQIFFATITVAAAITSGALGGQLPTEAPTRREIMRGQVLTDSGVPIAAAEVIATRAPDRAFKSATTSADGRYEIVWDEGTGDYLVHVAALDRKTLRKRVTRAGEDSVFVVDARLESSVQTIATVTVEAEKRKPTRNAGFTAPDVGAAEKVTDGVLGAVPSDLVGDLATAAATVPGISPTVGGISVLGLDAAQNSATLNGMAFGSSDIPADVSSRIRVTTSTYDPARGWFSGANTNVEIDAPGGTFSWHTAHATLDAPALQSTDRISSALVQRFSNVQAGVGGYGPVDDRDRFFYSFGLQGSRRTSALASLLDGDADLLQRGGLSADSAARLIQILRAANIPSIFNGAPSTRQSDNVSLLFRADHAPYDWKTIQPAKTTWAFTAFGKWARRAIFLCLAGEEASYGGFITADESGHSLK